MNRRDVEELGRKRAETFFFFALKRKADPAALEIASFFANATHPLPYPLMRAGELAARARWAELVAKQRRAVRILVGGAGLVGFVVGFLISSFF